MLGACVGVRGPSTGTAVLDGRGTGTALGENDERNGDGNPPPFPARFAFFGRPGEVEPSRRPPRYSFLPVH